MLFQLHEILIPHQQHILQGRVCKLAYADETLAHENSTKKKTVI